MIEISYFMDFINIYDVYAIFLILILCGLGLPLPEDITLITAGILTYNNNKNLFIMIIVCLLGVILGDFIAFIVGYFSGRKILENRLIKKIITNKNHEKINNFYLKYGNLFVFIGRFLPGLRMPIFLFAGIFKKVKPITFIFIDLLASVISVPLWVYVGYFFGGDFKKIKEFAFANTNTIFSLLCLILILYIVYKNMFKQKQ